MYLNIMAPKALSLDQLDWSPTGMFERCSYETAGWSCRSTGFLWFSEIRDGSERFYPCPRCNTKLFLAKSRERFTAKRGPTQCICCGPQLAHLAYQSALDEARLQTGTGLNVKGVAE
jgi:hypothetical protein